MLCQICKKNPAVIFMNKLEGGKTTRLALCLACAHKQGMQLKELFSQSGMTDEQAEAINKQIADMMQDVDPEQLSQEMGALSSMMPPGLMDMLSGSTPQGGEDENGDLPTEFTAEDSSSSSSDTEEDALRNKRRAKKIPNLMRFSTSLTDQARAGEIDTIVGRDKEIERVMQILNRRTKNNPVLLGEPGVGKTAIAEGLALRIARRQVPVKLLNKEIRLLDLTGLVAGTQFRGQFEGRMKGIINEVIQDGHIILVIDEIHNLIGAGDAQNAMNAANILKPALAKGQIQLIGTTTLDEYRKYIEKDSALERRFQPVIVDEPSPEETVEILKGIRPHYEAFHNVSIPDSVLEDAVQMSTCYIHQRYLPDKAIDLIDEAAAKVNLHNESLLKLDELKRQLTSVIQRKENAASQENFEEAANCRSEELRLQAEIDRVQALCDHVPLTREDIAQVVESWTKIPVHRLTTEESDKLLHLEERLHQRVVGQDAAVSALSRAIRRSRCGFRNAHRPASFIFAGPTGVGKTELAKTLAAELFGSEDAMIRVDMSEYMEKHTASKLIGAPPGYVGYDEGGQLSEKVRRRPYSVVLLDEIEKAHPDIFNMLLQILDDGRLTDNQGRLINFENTVIIMTTNAGSHLSGHSLGFTGNQQIALTQQIQAALKEAFRPEFLNRVDDIITFEPLTHEDLRKIVELMLKDIYKAAAEHDMKITVDPAVMDHLAEKGYDPAYGARPLRRLIQREIEDEIAEQYLAGKIQDHDVIFLTLDANHKITIEKRNEIV